MKAVLYKNCAFKQLGDSKGKENKKPSQVVRSRRIIKPSTTIKS